MRPATHGSRRAARPSSLTPASSSPSATRSPACPRSGRGGRRGSGPRPTCRGSRCRGSSPATSPSRAGPSRSCGPTSRPGSRGSSRYVRYLNRSLAFDWLYGYPGFDAALKDAVAADLVAGAEQMLALPSLEGPGPGLVPQPHRAGAGPRRLLAGRRRGAPLGGGARRAPARARLAGVRQPARADRAREPGRRLPRVDRLHAHHVGAARDDGRGAADGDRARTPPSAGPPSATWARPTSTRCCPTAARPATTTTSTRTSTRATTSCSATRSTASRTPTRPGCCSSGRGCPPSGRTRCSSSCGTTPRSCRATPRPRPRASCRATGSSAASATSSCATAGARTPPGSSSPAGPYLAKHDHLDAAHLVVYHKGYLAIDAGADYTDTESPHYLNHYRRTIAHNTVLVYQPGERFFWSENRWPAANDGGQRMDSSRFWNSVRSLEDWRRTRDLWDRCTLVARGRRADVPLRARRRDARLPAVEARVVHARDRAPARDERRSSCSTACARRTRPTARPGCSTA